MFSFFSDTPRNFYFLHTTTWMLNMFGIFFILAAHEHYSIDVFVAFYIASRLFLYYHTLANNTALMSHDSSRTRIWFPLFSYFESTVDGIIPNEYNSVCDMFKQVSLWIMGLKDLWMLTARRIWITPPVNPRRSRTQSQMSMKSKASNESIEKKSGNESTAKSRHSSSKSSSNENDGPKKRN